MPRPIQTLTLADARTLIAGAEKQAVELVVGAVGASGGTVVQDIKVADAAVAALRLT